MWKPWSKIMWLKEGDMNSKIFHTKVSFKKIKKNSVTRLQNEREEWLKGDYMEELILDYFQSIFSTAKMVGQIDFLDPLEGRVMD